MSHPSNRRQRRWTRECVRALAGWGLLLGLLAVQAAAAAPRPGAPPETAGPVVVQVHWYPQAQFAGFLMAKQKGFFREEGIGDVEIRWAAAGGRPLDVMVEGKADFCTGWLCDAMARRARGTPIVLLAQVTQRSAMMLVARRDSGIASPADMTGKRVGLWGGDFDVLPKASFTKYGVQPVIVPQSNSMVPFLRGAVTIASAMHYNEYHTVMTYCRRADVLTNRNHQRWMLRSMGNLLQPRDGGPQSSWGRLSADVYQGVAQALLDQGLIDRPPPFDRFYQPPPP